MMRHLLRAVLFPVGLWLAWPCRAHANGGKVQVADQPVGPYHVTVTTSPNPLRIGTADITVLVFQGVDDLVTDASVSIDAKSAGNSSAVRRYPATHEQATNKRYYAANVHFSTPGQWLLTVHVAGPLGGGQVQFTTNVSSSFLGMTLFELGCTSIPALAVAAIIGSAVWRWLRKVRSAPRPQQ